MHEDVSRLVAALADRYLIGRQLGAGGMATVYLAEDVKHHRQVAVKVLRSDLTATLGADRFLREIEIAAPLQHPHILPLLDSGEAGGCLTRRFRRRWSTSRLWAGRSRTVVVPR
jgi:serine/threonine-protein kinase